MTIHAIITWLGAIGSGESSSPLSVNSSLAELLRILQLGIAAGILYLINLAKKSLSAKQDNKLVLEKIDGVATQVTGIKVQVESLDSRVAKLEGNGVH